MWLRTTNMVTMNLTLRKWVNEFLLSHCFLSKIDWKRTDGVELYFIRLTPHSAVILIIIKDYEQMINRFIPSKKSFISMCSSHFDMYPILNNLRMWIPSSFIWIGLLDTEKSSPIPRDWKLASDTINRTGIGYGLAISNCITICIFQELHLCLF